MAVRISPLIDRLCCFAASRISLNIGRGIRIESDLVAFVFSFIYLLYG